MIRHIFPRAIYSRWQLRHLLRSFPVSCSFFKLILDIRFCAMMRIFRMYVCFFLTIMTKCYQELSESYEFRIWMCSNQLLLRRGALKFRQQFLWRNKLRMKKIRATQGWCNEINIWHFDIFPLNWRLLRSNEWKIDRLYHWSCLYSTNFNMNMRSMY